MLWTDKGKEYYNRCVDKLLKSLGMKLCSTENEGKSSVAERWNRTIKERMWRMFSQNNYTVCYDKLDKLLNEYYNKCHSSVKSSSLSKCSKVGNEKF